MRALVLSDIHGNIDALLAIEAEMRARPPIDQVWVLGDLVDFGPAPEEVIAWVRRNATHVVRGNHDHAMGRDEDCRSTPLFHDLAVTTRTYFRQRLSSSDLAYLAGLSLHATVTWRLDRRAFLVHATPLDPLFGYVPRDAHVITWRAAIAPAGSAEYLFVGHTHEQFTRVIGETTVVNPGSVGLPMDGDPRAAFAVFDNGRVELGRTAYDRGHTAARIAALPVPTEHCQRLTYLVRHARLPERLAHRGSGVRG